MSGKWTPGSAEPVGYIAEDTPAFFAKCGAITVSTGMLSHPNARENVPVYLHPDSAIVSELADALKEMVSLTTGPCNTREMTEALDRARAALAKAKGERA